MSKFKNRQVAKTIEQINAQYGKVPPTAIDLEKTVLGALIVEGDAFKRIEPIINEDSFYDVNHQKIYRVITKMVSRKQAVDLKTLAQTLKDHGHLDEIGGLSYILELSNSVSSARQI